MDAVLESHYAATARRMGQSPVVLAAQDTTSLNYSTPPAPENPGLSGSRAERLVGLRVRDTLAFNLEGTPLGLLDVQCWARDPEQFGKNHWRRPAAFEQNESVKWRRSLEAVERAQRQCPPTQMVSVGDRQADIYELLVWAREQPGRPHLLVRAEPNRRPPATGLMGEDQEGERAGARGPSHDSKFIAMVPGRPPAKPGCCGPASVTRRWKLARRGAISGLAPSFPPAAGRLLRPGTPRTAGTRGPPRGCWQPPGSGV